MNQLRHQVEFVHEGDVVQTFSGPGVFPVPRRGEAVTVTTFKGVRGRYVVLDVEHAYEKSRITDLTSTTTTIRLRQDIHPPRKRR